jgi:beta-catenin-like protein 1
LIAKFVEGHYEKVERLLEMREVAEGKVKAVDRDIALERRVSWVGFCQSVAIASYLES